MSSAKKTEISEINIENALQEISALSKNQSGLIINKRSGENLSKILSGADIDIENVASSPENSKEFNSSTVPDSPKPIENKQGKPNNNKKTTTVKIK